MPNRGAILLHLHLDLGESPTTDYSREAISLVPALQVIYPSRPPSRYIRLNT